MYGAFYAGAVLVGEVHGSVDLDPKVVDARRRFFYFVGCDADVRALGG